MILIHALEGVVTLLPYFAIATIFKPYMDSGYTVGAVLILVFFSSLLLEKSKNIFLRTICGLLPALGLLTLQNGTQLLFTIPALFIWFTLVALGKNEIYYEDYKYWFGIPAALVLLILLINLSKVISKLPASRLSIACASAYLFLGIIVLRRKRMGPGASAGARALNIAEIFAAALAGIMSCGLIWGLLILSRKLLEIIFLPFGILISAVVTVLTWFGDYVNSIQPVEESSASESASVIEDKINEAQELFEDVTPTEYPWAETAAHIIVGVLVAVLLVLLLFLIYKLIRGIRGGNISKDLQYEDAQDERFYFGKSGKKKRRREKRTNNNKIREIYREYLSFMRMNGVKISAESTSEEILEASKSYLDSREADRLRELYIRARYNDAEQLSDEEVQLAKGLLEEIIAVYDEHK
jgi:hypothetical protein